MFKPCMAAQDNIPAVSLACHRGKADIIVVSLALRPVAKAPGDCRLRVPLHASRELVAAPRGAVCILGKACAAEIGNGRVLRDADRGIAVAGPRRVGGEEPVGSSGGGLGYVRQGGRYIGPVGSDKSRSNVLAMGQPHNLGICVLGGLPRHIDRKGDRSGGASIQVNGRGGR